MPTPSGDDVPTYAYACTSCDHRFEAQQAFSDPSLTECPECSGRLRKLYNAVGIVFKGSGFYRTDSRGSSPAAESAASSSDSSASKPAESTPAKSDSAKPAASSSSSSSSSTSTSAA